LAAGGAGCLRLCPHDSGRRLAKRRGYPCHPVGTCRGAQCGSRFAGLHLHGGCAAHRPLRHPDGRLDKGALSRAVRASRARRLPRQLLPELLERSEVDLYLVPYPQMGSRRVRQSRRVLRPCARSRPTSLPQPGGGLDLQRCRDRVHEAPSQRDRDQAAKRVHSRRHQGHAARAACYWSPDAIRLLVIAASA
jgi:hypothetical protein